MELEIYPADISTIIFEPNPIEAENVRRFKRVAVVIPLEGSAGELRQKRMLSIQEYLERTFSKAVALCPILGGSVTWRENDGRLTALVSMPSVPARQRGDLIDIEYTLSDELVLEDINENLGGIFFPADRIPEAGVPPVSLKIAFFENLLILGFSFYEVIFDNTLIELFLSSMVDPSWPFGSGHSTQYYSARLKLNCIMDSPDLFLFYQRSKESTALRTTSNQLVSRVIEFQLHAVLAFIRNLRKYHFHCGNNSLDAVKDNDVMAAILWAAITNARRLLGKVQPPDRVRMNISVPGGSMPPKRRCGSLFGNITMPTEATASVLGVADLATTAAPYRNSYYQKYISGCGYGIRWISQAAKEIRRAIDKVNEAYVLHVMDKKQTMGIEEDLAAYERRLDRSRTGTTFEDWTDFYRSGCKTTGIPFTDTRQFIRILPCADDLEEGKIILLSHFKASNTAHCQTRQLAWLCLETETMKLVREQLEAEGWIKKESMTDMTTPPE
ncbi:hypothetical protein TRIATDRAFT_312397 [Trichoderma atroviride IMI 206040]|uniref:Uncharacterized protein n=1 Tax=Hypocrea atroviridis (strain ATCC 20476 / IMI 206040) TaxID=452589 RepID=G9P8Y8_HYPAI|nr:uncharacterized protein TRIATDRAFT_312397 [Trichoderma atroviride IMI 206040]EHK41860.1 hypothetical protein TRIATDRAFT_312397 [Trichoderma atroviride IMI 206040]